MSKVLGLAPDQSIEVLKEGLHERGLTPSPDHKLDLVLLEDLDHFAELVATEGIPLARHCPDAVYRRWMVKVEIRLGWIVTLGLCVSAMLVDDLLKAVTGIEVFPWM